MINVPSKKQKNTEKNEGITGTSGTTDSILLK